MRDASIRIVSPRLPSLFSFVLHESSTSLGSQQRKSLALLRGLWHADGNRLSDYAIADFGLPALGASSSRASTEALDTMRRLPSFQESSSPAFASCVTRAVLTPSSRAASAAVMAGMFDSSRDTASATTIPPCCGSWPNSTGEARARSSDNRRPCR